MNHSANPNVGAYYQVLADVIGITWRLHELRLSQGFPFATELGADLHRVPFSVSSSQRKAPERSILTLFGEAVADSYMQSYHRLITINSRSFIPQVQTPLDTSIDETVFRSEYVQSVLQTARNLGEYAAANKGRERNSQNALDDILLAGANTGAEIGSQLYPLLRDRAKLVASSILLARTQMETISSVRAHLGIATKDRSKNTLPTDFDLLDLHARYGINETFLADLSGDGKRVGCPASIPVSPDTEAFLRSIGAPSKGIMLRFFAEEIANRFDYYLGDWFREDRRPLREK